MHTLWPGAGTAVGNEASAALLTLCLVDIGQLYAPTYCSRTGASSRIPEYRLEAVALLQVASRTAALLILQ